MSHEPRPRPPLGDLLKPGAITEIRHVHEETCPMPKGGTCTCPNGPTIELHPIDLSDPRRN